MVQWSCSGDGGDKPAHSQTVWGTSQGSEDVNPPWKKGTNLAGEAAGDQSSPVGLVPARIIQKHKANPGKELRSGLPSPLSGGN